MVNSAKGSGGVYFLSAQSVIEKVEINKAKLCLQYDIDDWRQEKSGHRCELCEKVLSEAEAEVIDNLEELQSKLNTDTLASLVYISGVIQKNVDYLR